MALSDSTTQILPTIPQIKWNLMIDKVWNSANFRFLRNIFGLSSSKNFATMATRRNAFSLLQIQTKIRTHRAFLMRFFQSQSSSALNNQGLSSSIPKTKTDFPYSTVICVVYQKCIMGSWLLLEDIITAVKEPPKIIAISKTKLCIHKYYLR